MLPTFEQFKQLAKKGNLIPFMVEVVSDHVTPVSLLSSQWNKSPYGFLLESVEGGEKLGRYSIVSTEPEGILSEVGGVTHYSSRTDQKSMAFEEPLLDSVRRLMKGIKPVMLPELPRFYGGAVGYCSYELVHSLERLPKKNQDDLGWPQSLFMMTGDLFVFDNTQQTLKIIVCERIGSKSQLKQSYLRGRKRLEKKIRLLKRIKSDTSPMKKKNKGGDGEFHTTMTAGEYRSAVSKAKHYISAGDIIQVVLSRRMHKKTTASPLDIYRALRVVNPSPYMYLYKFKDRCIIGSSPESLVRLEKGHAMTRPIAGTRQRGKTVEQDLKLERDLLSDPKELAEHLMLVDLGRNDLGRVSEFGSVNVPIFMKIERYSHVMHIVSEVTSRLKNRKDGFDLLKAAFPAGTVSGAPKIRAMEIIDELENTQRGPYAGAVGYISYSGDMDMAITIRTILWDKGTVSIQTGAGIVADSIPQKELEETENKARGMKETIRRAERGDLFLENI